MILFLLSDLDGNVVRTTSVNGWFVGLDVILESADVFGSILDFLDRFNASHALAFSNGS